MRTSAIIEGLTILSRYYDKPDGHHNGADHDVIYAYPTDKPLSDVDITRMIELGWHQEHCERDYDKDMTVADYRPDESWHAYT